MELSPKSKDKLQEWYKCKNDPLYFIQKYVLLEIPGGDTNMNLYDPQKNLLKSLIDDHFIIVLKSRQTGISTLTRAYIVYSNTFFANVVTGMVSRDSAESSAFCRRLIGMVDKLPDWMRPEFVKKTEQTFVLDNGCEFYASQVSQSNPGKLFRGPAVTFAIVDEAAHIDKIDEAFTGFGPSLVKSQSVAKENGVPYGTIIISTPNKTTGIGKWYYDRWVQARESDGLYKPHEIHWSQVSEFKNNPVWYKQQCEILHNDPIKISQELEMKFLASHNSFFPPAVVEALNDCKVIPSTIVNIEKNDFLLWDLPDPTKFYLICIDTASESGKDKSTIEVIDYIPFEQVGEFCAKLRVDDFCTVIDRITKMFPRNLVIVENNSYGNQVVEFFTKNKGSYNLYMMKNHFSNKVKQMRYGISTNTVTRPLIIDALFTYVKENPQAIKSQHLALQLIGLQDNGHGKIEAPSGMNDDLALAWSFGCYVRMYDPPMSVASAENSHLAEEVMEIIGSNFGNYIPLPEDDDGKVTISKAELNSIVHRYLKNNLLKITNGSNSVIDVTKMLGGDR